ncbi:unnamed protein product, partial [Prorocentrum cordatum]
VLVLVFPHHHEPFDRSSCGRGIERGHGGEREVRDHGVQGKRQTDGAVRLVQSAGVQSLPRPAGDGEGDDEPRRGHHRIRGFHSLHLRVRDGGLVVGGHYLPGLPVPRQQDHH